MCGFGCNKAVCLIVALGNMSDLLHGDILLAVAVCNTYCLTFVRMERTFGLGHRTVLCTFLLAAYLQVKLNKLLFFSFNIFILFFSCTLRTEWGVSGYRSDWMLKN